MFTTYEVEVQTRGLNPHVKGDSLKLPALPFKPPNGRVTASQHKRSNNGVERLPAAKFSRGLVANENYNVESNNNQALADKSFRSLPNSSTQQAVSPARRHVTSAPGRKTRAARQAPQQLPQINNLVAGQLSKETETTGARVTRRDVPAHAKALHNINESNVHGHGRSTKDNALKPIENTRKFASNWAGARVDHLNRSPDPNINFTSIRDDKVEASPNRTKDSSISKPTHKDSKTYRNKPPDRSKPTSSEPTDKPVGSFADKSRSNGFTHKRNSNPVKDSDKENKDTKQKQRPKSVLPPRRERTRAAMLRKAKSEATLGLQKITKSQKEREKVQRRISHTDEAAKIYYTNVLQTEKTIVKDDANAAERNKSETDMNISLIVKTKKRKYRFEKQVPPWHRREYVLTKKEAEEYKRINNVYGNKTTKMRRTRQKQFYETLEKFQLQKWRQEHMEYQQKQLKRKESKHRQAHQLKEVRDKFEEEQATRFANQYVTSRILEHEWLNRHVYGLPEDINDEPQYAVKLKSKEKRPKETFDTKEVRTKNVRKFSNIFDIHAGPSWNPHAKPPKMRDNYETVMVEEMDDSGNVVSRTVDVEDILDEALDVLDNEDDEESPRINSPSHRRPTYHNQYTDHRDNSRDKLKRKNTVHFKEDPNQTKRERRVGVVERDRSKSPARKVSTREAEVIEPSTLKRENTGLKKQSSSQRPAGKKEKVELPKKNSYARKISTFTPLLLSQTESKDNDAQTEDKDTKTRDNDTEESLSKDNDAQTEDKDTMTKDNDRSTKEDTFENYQESNTSAISNGHEGKRAIETSPKETTINPPKESTLVTNEKAKNNVNSARTNGDETETNINGNRAATPKRIISPKHEPLSNKTVGPRDTEPKEMSSSDKEDGTETTVRKTDGSNGVTEVTQTEDEKSSENISETDQPKNFSDPCVRNGDHGQEKPLSASKSVERETTNVSHSSERKPGVKDTTIPDPEDIEDIPVKQNAKPENNPKRPLEREKSRVSFASNSQKSDQADQSQIQDVTSPHDQQHPAKDRVSEFKPKKKEVSFVEPTKESENENKITTDKKYNVNPKQSVVPKRDSTPPRKISVKRDTTPTRRDASLARDLTPPRKISKGKRPEAPASKKKESTTKGTDSNAAKRSIGNNIEPREASDTGKTPHAPAQKKKASTTQEPATYYINKDNPNVVVKKRTPPKPKPKPPTPKQSKPARRAKPKTPPATKPKESTDRDDVDSLDLSDSDDEDIFERAMRKYGITISDDDD